MQLSAVIFDLDGTVVEDEDEWGEAFGKVLKRLGVKKVTKYPHIGGIGIEENWPIFIKKYDIKTEKTYGELAAETKGEYENLIPKIKLKRGFKDFVKKLKNSDIPTALATSSTWDTVEKIFDKLGLEAYFDSVTTGEEVSHKKPDPQIFEIAAEKLGVEPKDCLVFEDSAAGIDAAHKVGMKVVALFRDKRHKEKLKGADKLVRNFGQVSVNLIASI